MRTRHRIILSTVAAAGLSLLHGCCRDRVTVPICGAERGLQATIVNCSGPIALDLRVSLCHPEGKPVALDRVLSRYEKALKNLTHDDIRIPMDFVLLSLDPFILVATPHRGPYLVPHHSLTRFDAVQYLHIAHNDACPPCMNFDWPYSLQVRYAGAVYDSDFVLTSTGETVVRHDDAAIVLSMLGERARIRDGVLEVDLRVPATAPSLRGSNSGADLP